MRAGWSKVSLGEVARIDRKGVRPNEIPTGTKYVGLEHIERGGRLVGFETIGKVHVASTKFTFTRDHVLYGKLRPNLGKIARPNFSGVCSTDILPILPSEHLDRDYLAHYLSQQRMIDFAASRATGANLPRLSPSELARFPVPLPSLAEQRRIAAILDRADSLRMRRESMSSGTDELVKSMFLEAFGTETETVSLAEGLEGAPVFNDGDWVESKDQDPGGSVRLTQLADIGDGRWLDKSHRFLTEDKAAELRCTYLEPGDVLVARMPDPLGRACVFPGADMPCITVVDVAIIRPPEDRFDPQWLAACINSAPVRRQIERFATGTTRLRISRRNLSKVRIPRVTIERQREFVSQLGGVNALDARMTQATAKLDDAFAALRARAFSGRL